MLTRKKCLSPICALLLAGMLLPFFTACTASGTGISDVSPVTAGSKGSPDPESDNPACITLPDLNETAPDTVTESSTVNPDRETGKEPETSPPAETASEGSDQTDTEYTPETEPDPAALLPEGYRSVIPSGTRILHACGTADGITGTNSLEALEQSYAAGGRFFEIDFCHASDGVLCAIHDWSSRFCDEIQDGIAPSSEEFLSMRLGGSLTPMTLPTVLAFMETHPDTLFVSDIKDGNTDAARQIAESAPALKDRWIIQIYQYDELADIRALGFSNILLTIYNLDPYTDKFQPEKLAAFAASNGLAGLTFPVSLAEEAYIASMRKYGIPVLTHTVNGTETQAAFFAMGIDGIYTDYAPSDPSAPEETK